MIKMQNIFHQQKRNALELKKLHIEHREHVLRSLRKSILDYETEIQEALYQDFRKPKVETLLTEIFPALSELNHTLRHLRKWTRPQPSTSNFILPGTKAKIHYEPKGTVLIISPWNYPFLLAIQPLISALAAGNTVILKPSELTPHTTALLKKILSDLFPPEYVHVFEGDKTVSQKLLTLPFDHIFFTGSTQSGQLIMQEAAKNLTPVTLELGGKTPVILANDSSLIEAARKIIWGKVLNLGQICIAPDYVFVPSKKADAFIELCLQEIRKQTHEHTLPLVINEEHHSRLQKLIQNALDTGGKVSSLSANKAPREMGISLLKLTKDQAQKAQIMQEEIFGPLLPILTYETLDEAISWIQDRSHPLCLYVFTHHSETQKKVLQETSSGGVCINDIIIQAGLYSLPFGGIGQSGMGQYHGFEGFRTFSHLRSVLERKYFSSAVSLFYPPYKKFQEKLIRLMIQIGL